jgi:hypothetical protein
MRYEGTTKLVLKAWEMQFPRALPDGGGGGGEIRGGEGVRNDM